METENMIWTILIPTTVDRRSMFERLYLELQKQIAENKLIGKVEVLFNEDAKQISVGKKRQILLEESKAKWIVFFDSDDEPYSWYVEDIYNAIASNPNIDCIGINCDMTSNGLNPQRCCHRLKYKVWMDKVAGWDYVRNVTHRNPVLRSLALQVGFKDLRHGEDKDYSDRLTPLCKKEFYIERPNFHYKYSSAMPHDIKYGIRK